MEYHRPVLLEQSIEGLKIQSSGIYVDVTFGGGGHSKSILTKLGDKGHLFAFDRDEEARSNVWNDPRLTFVASNYRHLEAYLDYYQVASVDGILADLGVSSHQFDDPGRGFSYRQDQALDMRMNSNQVLTAADIVNEYDQKQLVAMFSDYGQVRNAKTLAARIVQARGYGRIETVDQFLSEIDQCIRGQRMRYLSQVFQSLRIEVNAELDALQEFMRAAITALSPGGRLVVITYHSIEDRVVKYWMRAGRADGIVEKDEFGHPVRQLIPITRKPIVPTADEIAENNRARSAKLRIVEKVSS